jgi:hypothetical protein
VTTFSALLLATLLAPIVALAGTPGGIPLGELGAEVEKKSAHPESSISRVKDGARLQAAMQDLEGTATPTGLWLTSTASEDQGKPNRLRLLAAALSRVSAAPGAAAACLPLATEGRVSSTADAAVWIRPGLIEEYTVSTDGVRQDFVIPERLAGAGDLLCVDLSLSGAQAEATRYGAKLTLTATGRELAYSRLKVTDATGRELAAEMQVPAPDRLSVVVQDAAAVYPLRVDPTFSDADWVSVGGFAGANNTVNAIAVDGAGNLYIGGHFTAVGTVQASCIAKWDGSAWSALGSGMNNDVKALVCSGSGDLYVGGLFTTAGGISASRIAKWNGSEWSALDSGTNSDVAALAMMGGNLYAGGNFITAGGVSVSCIAKWDGSAWSALGAGVGGQSYPWVYSLVASGGSLYVGGYFTTAGAVGAAAVAKWDGSAWSAIGSAIYSSSDYVSSLAVSGGNLYAGGSTGLFKWDGSTWQGFGALAGYAATSMVYAIAISGTDVYVSGSFFSTIGGQGVADVVKWNGTTWSAIGKGGQAYAMVMSGSDLIAGGGFTQIGGVTASCIARWNGSAWSAFSSGLCGSYVFALAVMNGDLYVGGDLSVATGGQDARYIARWDGSTWSALGTGMDAPVYSLAVNGSDLYAGGQFSTAGGVAAGCIAKWDGSAWSALGSGVSSQTPAYTFIYALAFSGSDLYAGGNFTTAGGSSISYIAKWGGSAWSAVGTSTGLVYAPVWCLAVDGSTVYAGGESGVLAQWDGSSWSPLGPGMNGLVRALAVGGGRVYAGGEFYATYDGSVSATGLAQWDGSTWSAVGAYSGGYVYALAVSGSLLYAGGAANNLAKWNGTAWFSLGSGVSNLLHDSGVYALTASGSYLYVGGSFDTAGGSPVPHLARADILPNDAPTPTLGAASGIGVVSATLNGTVNPNGFAATAVFEYGPTTSYGSTATATFTPTDGTTPQNVSVNISGLTSGTVYHYRLTATSSIGTNSTSDGTFNTLMGLKDFRMLFFGTTSNTGTAADTADPDGDGIPNLLEWVFGLVPTFRDTMQPTQMVVSGANIQFFYLRNQLALQEGMGITLEWSDTLAAGSWSNAGVVESVLPGPPYMDIVTAQVPQGTNGRRFVRLSVTPPP